MISFSISKYNFFIGPWFQFMDVETHGIRIILWACFGLTVKL